jgi:hypothetical protein
MDNIEHEWFSVAEEQLLVAIDLYCTGSSYYSALTLAGAAEEILGNELSENRGKQNAIDPMVEQLMNSLTEEEQNELGGKKEIKRSFNEFRNFLKHRKVYDTSYCDLKAECWDMLQRAVENYLSITKVNEGKIFDFKFETDPRTA